MNEMHRRLAPILLAALPVTLAGCGSAATNDAAAVQNGAAPLAGARIGGPFALTDQNGHAVTDRSFAGQYRVMYFGYTSCPDVCPTDAQSIGQGLRLLEQSDPAKAARVTPVFVSVDPGRDTPAVLRQFVSSFHPRMVGLTGSPDAIAAVAREYAVSFTRQPAGGATAAADGPGLGGGYRHGATDGPGVGGDYGPQHIAGNDGPGAGGGYRHDGPGAGGGYRQGDGPGLGGGYRQGGSDGPGVGGGYRHGASDGPGAGGGYRQAADGPGLSGGYLVSHTRVAYLMGPDGQPIALIPEDQGPQAVAAALAQWVQ